MRHGTILPDDPSSVIEGCITELLAGSANITTFYKIAGLSLQNPVTIISPPMSPLNDPSSPISFDSSQSLPSLHCDVWEKNKNLDRLLKAMVEALTPEKVSPSQFDSYAFEAYEGQDGDMLETGLIAVYAIIENQLEHLEGKEAEIFSMLFRIRYSNKMNVGIAQSSLNAGRQTQAV